MLRLTEEQLAARAKKLDALKQSKVAAKPASKQSKFHNVSTEVDGIKFASKKEAKRWEELVLLQKSGVITNLERQVKFNLIPSQVRSDGTKERPVDYVADFTYWSNGVWIIEDSKGVRTPDYVIKRKLLLFSRGITIKET